MHQGDSHLYGHYVTIAGHIESFVGVDFHLYGLSFFIGENGIPIADPKRCIVGTTSLGIRERVGKGGQAP